MHLEGNCRWVSLTHVDLLNFLRLFNSFVMNGCFKTYLFTPTKQQIISSLTFNVSLQCKSTGSSKLLRLVFLIRPPFAALLLSVTKGAEPGMILMHVWYGYGKFNIRFNGPKLWNELDERFKCHTSNQFRK